MKSNQSFIFNEKNNDIKMLSKEDFKKEVLKFYKINTKDYKLTQKYSDIIKNYPDLFKKLDTGIYYKKLSDSKILICLINKNIDDFIKIYNKKSDNKNDEQEISNEKISEIRNMKINKTEKETIKKNIKKAAVVALAAVVGMNMFACTKTPATNERPAISIDVQEKGDDGLKIQETWKPLPIEERLDRNKNYQIDRSIEDENHIFVGYGHGFFTCTTDDEKDWPIGGKGFPEPPEDYRSRTRVTLKPGIVYDEIEESKKRRLDGFINSYAFLIKSSTTGQYYAINTTDNDDKKGRSVYRIRDINQESYCDEEDLVAEIGSSENTLTATDIINMIEGGREYLDKTPTVTKLK